MTGHGPDHEADQLREEEHAGAIPGVVAGAGRATTEVTLALPSGMTGAPAPEGAHATRGVT